MSAATTLLPPPIDYRACASAARLVANAAMRDGDIRYANAIACHADTLVDLAAAKDRIAELEARLAEVTT